MEGVGGSELNAKINEAHFTMMELPLYSMGGIQRLKTMKFYGIISGQNVVVLVDSGVNHNFVSSKVVQQLQLPVSKTLAFRVKLGDGYRISSTGMCKNLNYNYLNSR